MRPSMAQLEIRYRDRVMRWTEVAIPAVPKPARRAVGHAAGAGRRRAVRDRRARL